MSKYIRHQPIISRHSDAYIDEDNWLHRFEQSLLKGAVQSRQIDHSIFDQINSIMNNKSKYPSVQAAVDDMKNRSGLTAYLNKINKTSSLHQNNKKSTDDNSVIDKKIKMSPIIITKCPAIGQTIQNYIESTKGNLSVPAIISKIRSIHQNDISEASDWEDDKLIRHISKLNLAAKSKNNSTNNDNCYRNLGIQDHFDDNDIDPSNTDPFNILNPTKI